MNLPGSSSASGAKVDRKWRKEEWNLHCYSSLMSPQWSVKSHTLSGGTENPLPHWNASAPCWTSGERKTQKIQGTQEAPFFGNASILARQKSSTWYVFRSQAVVIDESLIRNIIFLFSILPFPGLPLMTGYYW